MEELELIEEKATDNKPIADNKAMIVKIKEFVFQYWEFRLNGYTQDLEYRSLIDDDNNFKVLDDFAFNDMVYYLKESGFKSRISDDLKTILFSSQVNRNYEINNFLKQQPTYVGTTEIDKWCDMLLLKEPNKNISYRINEKEEAIITYNAAKRLLLKKWLISCVHSVLFLKPNDVMLILISDQGKFKTSFLNALCPKELQEYLFTGHIVPSITENNTANLLAEKMFINVDDQMEQVFGKEFNAMKAIISTDSVTNRKVYKKFAPKRKRIANFMGSVNNAQFLTDNENRRYLCLEIEKIDPNYESININRLWAEAYQLANKTKIYQNFTGADRALINAISLNFTALTIEHEYLTTLFDVGEDNGKDNMLFMKASEILKIIQYASGGRNLSIYKLNIALKREKYQLINKRLKRLSNLPYKIYCLKPKPGLLKLNLGIEEFENK